MLRLRVKAPFAAFRTFSAGSYRPTAPFVTPSAAYGLLLNIAAIESRRDDGQSPMTLVADDLPPADLAIAAISEPAVQRLYQQLHNYPVGATGKERSGETRGNKYNIQPVRRELLSEIDAYICLQGNDWLEARVREGLRLGNRYAPEGRLRYGVPFLGDNNHLLSVLREETDPVPSFWYVPAVRNIDEADTRLARLTVWIDRQNMSRTVTRAYRLSSEPAMHPPDGPAGWTRLPPEARP